MRLSETYERVFRSVHAETEKTAAHLFGPSPKFNDTVNMLAKSHGVNVTPDDVYNSRNIFQRIGLNFSPTEEEGAINAFHDHAKRKGLGLQMAPQEEVYRRAPASLPSLVAGGALGAGAAGLGMHYANRSKAQPQQQAQTLSPEETQLLQQYYAGGMNQ